MKKILSLLFVLVLGFVMVGCTNPDNGGDNPPDEQTVKYTVQFYVNEELYKTLKIEKDSVIGSSKVDVPLLEGFKFTGWVDASQKAIDLDTYKVTANLKLHATFEEVITDEKLVVDATKEEGVKYFLVVGWWETTALNDDSTPKITSSLTPDTVRVFYANLLLYLKAWGATEEQIALVQFRNYSTEKVAEMGTKINGDGDVDLIIGVGNNINTTAGVSLFEGNDGKTTANMGTQSLSRYVALPEHEEMSKLAISIFDWIKTEVGQTAFTTQLEESQITVVPERSDKINVTVTVHGLTEEENQVSVLTSKEDVITVPEITVSENHKFMGYATTADATVAEIIIASGIALTYDQIEELLKGSDTLDLYPVVIEEVVDTTNDLDVYVHVTSTSKISEAEAQLFALRFESTLAEAKRINYVWVTEGKAADFNARIEADIAAGINIDVVIGGNASTKLLSAIDAEHGNATCGAKHFADSSRKIIVLSTATTTHVELAKSFYDFMVAEASELQLQVAFWTNWVTTAEVETITASMNQKLNTLLATEDASTIYGVSIVCHNITKTTLAEISAETKALNGGSGVGMIIGSEDAAASLENMGSSILKQIECPKELVAAERKVALCEENFIYDALCTCFVAEVA